MARLKKLHNFNVSFFFLEKEKTLINQGSSLHNYNVTEHECLLVGRDQSRLTAKVAATVAVYSGDLPGGVFHIEQWFELSSIKGWLEKEASIEVWRDGVKGII